MNRPLRPLWLLVLLGGCTPTPLPQPPASDIPTTFEQPVGRNAPTWPKPDWWQGFGDAELTRLVTAAESGNLDLAQAAARVRQADARTRQAGAALLPSLALNASADSFYGQAGGASAHETDWSAALGASYELDFWGKNRDALLSADAAREASAADRATVALTVSTAVANSYFQLLSLRERIALARENLKTSQDILNLVQRRVGAGYAANSDLTQERANLAAEQAVLPPLEQQELETRNALAILLGRPPERFTVAGDSLQSLSGPVVAPGLPAELLTRRPDVAMAEANLAAAHADLEAARTAFLPTLTLTANGGLSYPALAAAVDTLPGTGLAATIGAALAQTIFDGGKAQAKTAEAEARQEELLAAYRAAILSAYSDVENALGQITHLEAQQAALQAQVTEAEKVLTAARRKYDSGYADFLTVTEAERSLNTARDQLSDVSRARLTALVALYKALGGGWQKPASGALN